MRIHITYPLTLLIFACIAVGLLCSCAPTSKNTSDQLNFVFILADDLGWADIGCYGSDLHETPRLDTFAEQGMRFTNAYAAAPVCSPTRASILSGKWPARLHMTIWSEGSQNPPRQRKVIPPVTRHDLPLDEITLAEVLKDAGYQTAHIGKWHLGDSKHYPQAQGFDINIGGSLWGAPQTFWWPYKGTQVFEDYRYLPGLGIGATGEYLTDRLTDEALAQMERMQNDPFYLNLSYHTVHTPIEGKPEIVDYYQKKLTPDMHHQNAEYAAMVQSLDENVGRVLDKIDALGIADRTVVIFFSDNGGYINPYKGKVVTSNHPLRSGKGSLYEGGIREPLLIRWPGVTTAGSMSDALISSVDFYPTLLELYNLPGNTDHQTDGVSLASLMKNPDTSLDRETLYWHYPHYYATTPPVSAIRQGDWKLLEYLEEGNLELYNLREDLGESKNLAEAKPEKAAELKRLLEEWRTDVDAQLPKLNPTR